MDDLLFLVFVQLCVAWIALFGFSACFVPVDLCYGGGVFFLLAVSFVDLFCSSPAFCVFPLVCFVTLLLCSSVCLQSLVGCRGGVRLARGVTEFVVSLRGIVCILHEISVFGLVSECWRTVLCLWLLESFSSGFGETSLLVYR